MLLNLDHDAKTPLYIQIYQQLKEKIHANALKTNEKLTSKRQLAELNHVSENTVMNAYNQLLTEGYIYSQERKGYFVADVQLHYELPSLTQKEVPVPAKPAIQYNLTRSNPDKELFPFSVFSKLYRKVMQMPSADLLQETDGQGLYELRVSLQHYLSQSRGVPCTVDQILLGPSAEYLLSILLQLLDTKPHIGVENLGYTGFQALFNRLQLETTPIPVDENGANIKTVNASDIDLMIVTSNHQFPTGSIMPLPRRQELLDWAYEKENRYILENDYDSEFKYSGVPIPSLKYLDQQHKVIHLGSFTRILSPGIRLSYMVLPDSLLEQYQIKFPTHSAALSTAEQWVIRDFINESHFATHLNRSRTFYRKKRDLMIQTIRQLDPEANIYGENAGLHLLVSPSFHYDGLRFKERALKEGIQLNLLSDFAMNSHEDYENILFLSFSNIPKEEMENAIKKLVDLAKKCIK